MDGANLFLLVYNPQLWPRHQEMGCPSTGMMMGQTLGEGLYWSRRPTKLVLAEFLPHPATLQSATCSSKSRAPKSHPRANSNCLTSIRHFYGPRDQQHLGFHAAGGQGPYFRWPHGGFAQAPYGRGQRGPPFVEDETTFYIHEFLGETSNFWGKRLQLSSRHTEIVTITIRTNIPPQEPGSLGMHTPTGYGGYSSTQNRGHEEHVNRNSLGHTLHVTGDTTSPGCSWAPKIGRNCSSFLAIFNHS